MSRHISNSTNNENSEYIICAHKNKNCYLSDEIDGSRDCYFGYNVQYCNNVLDCMYIRDSEICYDVVKGENCYLSFFSKNVFNCADSAFLLNCRNTKNCLFCCNLRNKQHYIFNKKVTPAEFQQEWDKIFTGNDEDLQAAREKYEDFFRTQIFPAGILVNCEDCTGNYLSNCKNTKDCFCIDNCRDCRYCSDLHYSRDCYDVNIYEGEVMYESVHVGPKGYGHSFSLTCWYASDIYYCIDLRNCQNCFPDFNTHLREG